MYEIDGVIFDEGERIDAVMRELTEEQLRELQEGAWHYFEFPNP